jgi:protein-S-isoprenylcysteine O-methyltransferase Ste14
MAFLYAPSRLGAALFAVCFFGWAAFELVVNLRLWHPASQHRDRFTRLAILGGMLLAFALAVAATRLTAFSFAAPPVFWLGLGLMLGGLVFRLVAIRQLGRAFVPEVAIQPGQRLFTGGLYATLRHPSYTGTFLTILGYALALGNWLSLGVMLLIPGLVYGLRIVVEEAALLEAFGDDYRAYMRRTWRVIPFIM